MDFKVDFAVYGALTQDGGKSEVKDVTKVLMDMLNRGEATIPINNKTFGDPAPGHGKHFGAIVHRDGTPYRYACKEDQTIDFAAN
ncbi:MAG: hypothetical protein PQJ46_14280 [Spirochaetales bacterium]|nr:hypothetical protein [Spirochaetales bacterium]